MAKKKRPEETAKPLTEWQKRNLEFQQRRQERLLAKERLEAETTSEKPVENPEIADQAEATTTVKKGDQGKKPAKAPKKERRGLPKSLFKALPILLVAFTVLLLALVTISPISKQKTITVQGVTHTNQEAVIKATGIKASDYISHVALNLSHYEKQLVAKDPWVKSAKMAYKFPNTFTITVEEYGIVAYHQTADGFRPLLENGQEVAKIGDGELPEGSLALSFETTEDTQSFVKQFVSLDPSVRQAVKIVERAPSKATPDLLLLTMAEGHSVRVPLSEIALKLPYYKTIKDKLTFPQIIDMEVGIYTTTPELEASAAETKASKEQESREYEALYGSSSGSSGSSSSTTTRTETSSSPNAD